MLKWSLLLVWIINFYFGNYVETLWILFTSSVVTDFFSFWHFSGKERERFCSVTVTGYKSRFPTWPLLTPESERNFSLQRERWEFWFPTRPSLILLQLGGVEEPWYCLPHVFRWHYSEGRWPHYHGVVMKSWLFPRPPLTPSSGEETGCRDTLDGHESLDSPWRLHWHHGVSSACYHLMRMKVSTLYLAFPTSQNFGVE